MSISRYMSKKSSSIGFMDYFDLNNSLSTGSTSNPSISRVKEAFSSIRNPQNSEEVHKALKKMKNLGECKRLIDLLIKRKEGLKKIEDKQVLTKLEPLFKKIRVKFMKKVTLASSPFMQRQGETNDILTVQCTEKVIGRTGRKKNTNTFQQKNLPRKSLITSISTLQNLLRPQNSLLVQDEIEEDCTLSKGTLRKRLSAMKHHMPYTEKSKKSKINKKANFFEYNNQLYEDYMMKKYGKTDMAVSKTEKSEINTKLLMSFPAYQKEFETEIVNYLLKNQSKPENFNFLDIKESSSRKSQFLKSENDAILKFKNILKDIASKETKDKASISKDTAHLINERRAIEKAKLPFIRRQGSLPILEDVLPEKNSKTRIPKKEHFKSKMRFQSLGEEFERNIDGDSNNSFASYTEQKLDQFYKATHVLNKNLERTKNQVTFLINSGSQAFKKQTSKLKKKKKEKEMLAKLSTKISNLKISRVL